MPLNPVPTYAARLLAGLALLLLAAGLSLPSTRAHATTVPEAGGFSLTDQTGRRVTGADLKGRPYALFFGFTHCPDVCPTALYELSLVLGKLGPGADALDVLFVTVDPDRDTQEQLATYLGSFDPRIRGLRGTAEQTAAAARAFKATYRRVPLEDGDYTMDHTAVIYLVDREGRLFETVDYRDDIDRQVAAFRRLLATP